MFVHVDEQTEFEQNGVAPEHTVPQAPQLFEFDLRSTHPLAPHTVPVHVAGAPPEPLPARPAEELPLPAVPGPSVGELAEQLIASNAEDPSVSEAPTNFARNELEFGRNRFHIRTPNLKVRRLPFESFAELTPPRRHATYIALFPL